MEGSGLRGNARMRGSAGPGCIHHGYGCKRGLVPKLSCLASPVENIDKKLFSYVKVV